MRGTLEIPFKNEKEAKLALESIGKPAEDDRAQVSIRADRNKLVVEIDSKDIVALRARMNAYCRQLYPLLNIEVIE